MRDRLKIFLDMNGVLVDLVGGLINLYPEEERNGFIQRLKEGEEYKDVLLGCWDRVSSNPQKFWEGLMVFPWTDKLMSICSNYGSTAILSSVESPDRSTLSDAYSHFGKMKLVSKYFGEIPLVITKAKYLLGTQYSILIDDTRKRVDSFRKHGGNIFLWPNQYHILDRGYPIDLVLGNLERRLQSINSA